MPFQGCAGLCTNATSGLSIAGASSRQRRSGRRGHGGPQRSRRQSLRRCADDPEAVPRFAAIRWAAMPPRVHRGGCKQGPCCVQAQTLPSACCRALTGSTTTTETAATSCADCGRVHSAEALLAAAVAEHAEDDRGSEGAGEEQQQRRCHHPLRAVQAQSLRAETNKSCCGCSRTLACRGEHRT